MLRPRTAALLWLMKSMLQLMPSLKRAHLVGRSGLSRRTNENSPAFQRWVKMEKEKSPEGTAERIECECDETVFMGVIQPSLRDLFTCKSEPGSELPGYFQISPGRCLSH